MFLLYIFKEKRIKMNVYIIDDNKIYAEAIAISLRKQFNFELKIFTDDSFLALIETEKPDLIICDYNLKFSNALEVMNRVRTLGLESKFIVITGAASTKEIVEILKLNPFDMIEKDLDFIENLTESINTIIN